MNLRFLLVACVLVSIAGFYLNPLASTLQPAPWLHLYTIVNGMATVELGKGGQPIEVLVSVWVNCSSSPCRYESFVHWVKARPDHSLNYLATTGVAELNASPEVRIARVYYYSMDNCFIFELGDGNPKLQRKFYLWPRGLGKYEVFENK